MTPESAYIRMDGDSPGLEPFVVPSNCVATSPDLFSSEDEDTSHSGKSHVMSCLQCISNIFVCEPRLILLLPL